MTSLGRTARGRDFLDDWIRAAVRACAEMLDREPEGSILIFAPALRELSTLEVNLQASLPQVQTGEVLVCKLCRD